VSGVGTWDAPLEDALDIVGAHAVVLYTGEVLYWCFDQRAVGQLNVDKEKFNQYFANPNLGTYQLWDPTNTNTHAATEIGSNVFCAGQCALPDGTIFVAGGQDEYGAVEFNEWYTSLAKWLGDALFGGSDEGALKGVHTYDPAADRWIDWPDMADGRYYPTCLELYDGSAFVAGGLSNLQRWVFSGGTWCENDQFETYPVGQLAFAPPPRKFESADQYPIIRLLPGTHQLFVHEETTTRIFDLDTASFVSGAEFTPPAVGRQTYPMQTGHVLLPQRQGDPPRILIVGGSTASGFDYNTHSDAPGVQDGFIFEFDADAPASSRWRKTAGRMHDPRLLSDTVLLPDGTVFVVNGISVGAAAGHSGPAVGTAEIFDPSTEVFTRAASPSILHPRGYHSTAVLLPDARVAVAGNSASYNPGEALPNDDLSIEIYNPPYLSAGPRPVVATPVPSSLDYGASLNIVNSGPALVDAAMLMRPCAVTHSVDMDQRAIILTVAPGSTAQTLDITMPTDRSLAPPGPYMLFFLAAGVPSIAAFVFLGVPAPKLGGSGPATDCADGGPWTGADLGTLDGSHGSPNLAQTVDGDVTIERVENGFHLVLTSDHGGISIHKKIDQHSYANLTACGTVEIHEKVDQHSIAEIVTQGDVLIGQSIDQTSKATITSLGGHIEITEKVDQHSGATLTAATFVSIGQKIDQHSNVKIVAQDNVTIVQGIDQWATADITSVNGSILIGQAVDGNASATLNAPNGSVKIGQKVAGGASVQWHAQSFSCPDTSGGTVTQI
jgi:hypothetical protein